MSNVAELNAAAQHLRMEKDMEGIKALARAWAVPYQHTQDYIEGKRYRLADVPVAKGDFKFPSEKLREEMLALDDKYFADVIGWHITRLCRDDEELAVQVLKSHKSLQHCMDFITEKAYEVALGQAREKGMERIQANTGLALTEKEVFPWAEEYYRKEDEEDIKKKEEEEKKKILAEWERRERPAVSEKKAETKKKKSGNRKTKKAEKETETSSAQKEQEASVKTEKKKEEKKKEEKKEYGQMSLFDLPQ